MISEIIKSTFYKIELTYLFNLKRDIWRWLLMLITLNATIALLSLFMSEVYSIISNSPYDNSYEFVFFSLIQPLSNNLFLSEIVVYYVGGLILIKNMSKNRGAFVLNVFTKKLTNALLLCVLVITLSTILLALIDNYYLAKSVAASSSVEFFIEGLNTSKSLSTTLPSLLNGISILTITFLLLNSTLKEKLELNNFFTKNNVIVALLALCLYFGITFLKTSFMAYVSELLSIVVLYGGIVGMTLVICITVPLVVISFPLASIAFAETLNFSKLNQRDKNKAKKALVKDDIFDEDISSNIKKEQSDT